MREAGGSADAQGSKIGIGQGVETGTVGVCALRPMRPWPTTLCFGFDIACRREWYVPVVTMQTFSARRFAVSDWPGRSSLTTAKGSYARQRRHHTTGRHGGWGLRPREKMPDIVGSVTPSADDNSGGRIAGVLYECGRDAAGAGGAEPRSVADRVEGAKSHGGMVESVRRAERGRMPDTAAVAPCGLCETRGPASRGAGVFEVRSGGTGEDGVDDVRGFDADDDALSVITVGAVFDVDAQDAVEALHPGHRYGGHGGVRSGGVSRRGMIRSRCLRFGARTQWS